MGNDALKNAGSAIPGVGGALDSLGKVPGGDDLLKDMLIGKPPEDEIVPHIPIADSGPTKYDIARQLYEQGYGNTAAFPNGFPSYDEYKNDEQRQWKNIIDHYLGQDVMGDLTKADNSYQSTLPHTPPKFGG